MITPPMQATVSRCGDSIKVRDLDGVTWRLDADKSAGFGWYTATEIVFHYGRDWKPYYVYGSRRIAIRVAVDGSFRRTEHGHAGELFSVECVIK